MNNQAFAYTNLIEKCWTDASFKVKFLASPAEMLALEGVQVLSGMSVHVVENTSVAFTIVIPAAPEKLSEDLLELLGQHSEEMAPHFQALP